MTVVEGLGVPVDGGLRGVVDAGEGGACAGAGLVVGEDEGRREGGAEDVVVFGEEEEVHLGGGGCLGPDLVLEFGWEEG